MRSFDCKYHQLQEDLLLLFAMAEDGPDHARPVPDHRPPHSLHRT